MNTFGQRLLAILKENHISSYKLAKEIHVSRATISNYINGKTKPSGSILYAMSQYLKVSREWILTGQGDKTSEGHSDESVKVMSLRDRIELLKASKGLTDRYLADLLKRSDESFGAAVSRGSLSSSEKEILERRFGLPYHWLTYGTEKNFATDDHSVSEPEKSYDKMGTRWSTRELVIYMMDHIKDFEGDAIFTNYIAKKAYETAIEALKSGSQGLKKG
ncbi:MAG: helix-turn-helix transcriptional regulator [Flavobacteriales bacterium]